MQNTVAVMNTKGGVGKSTVLLALAETLSSEFSKSVLVVDADAQASISSMLMTPSQLFQLQTENRTLVDYLVQTVLNQNENEEWAPYVVRDVSDVDDAASVFLLPSDVQLTLFEREVSRESLHGRLRLAVARLLSEVRPIFDVVLIDCPPGLSVLTETWLRECDFHLTPTKADYISTCGLEVFRRFKTFDPEMGFAENLGVAVNMFDPAAQSERDYREWLMQTPDNRCFASVIPRVTALQDASRHLGEERSYLAKYPGEAGRALRAFAGEFVARLDQASADAASAAPGGVSSEPLARAAAG